MSRPLVCRRCWRISAALYADASVCVDCYCEFRTWYNQPAVASENTKGE